MHRNNQPFDFWGVLANFSYKAAAFFIFVVMLKFMASNGDFREPTLVPDVFPNEENRLKTAGFSFLIPELKRLHLIHNHNLINALIDAKKQGRHSRNQKISCSLY